MGTQEVELEFAGEKSAVDGSDPVCIIRPKSSWRVTHDSHKLQTKAIHHSTRHYTNRGELQSDQPIHVPLLRVLSPPFSAALSACIVAIYSQAARGTPSNHTQGYGSCNCSELRCYILDRIH